MNAAAADKNSSDVVEFRAPGPGERLRNARVAKDIDIRKMASKLHLITDIVEALERDDYAELPARVFVRGYVRNYARLVDLPIDSVMVQFDDLWPEDEATVKIDKAPRLAADLRPGRHWSGAITWLLLVVSLVLFLIWRQGYLDRPAQTGEPPAPAGQSRPEAVPPAGSLPPKVEPPAPAGQSRPEAVPPAGSLPPGVEQPAPAIVEGPGLLPLPPAPLAERPAPLEAVPPAPAPVEQAESVPAAIEASEIEAVVEKAGPADSATAPLEAVMKPEPPVVLAEPVAQQAVLMRFKSDCWVDIRGSNRSFKLLGTMRKDTERRLEGEAPYKFVLGNASAVELEVNGEPFDLGPHTRDNVARFSLSL